MSVNLEMMMKRFFWAIPLLLSGNLLAGDYALWESCDHDAYFGAEAYDIYMTRSDESLDAIERSILSFYKLPLTHKESQTITKIVTQLANSNLPILLIKKPEIVRMGDSIHHIHPLRFLGHIFYDQDLHNCMRTIRRSYFKWRGFIDGLSERMEEEMNRQNITPYLFGFASYIKREPKEILSYLLSRDWEGLVYYLIKSKPIDS